MATFGTVHQDVPPEDREYVEKLAKLQNIHSQIHNLRSLLPERLLKPARAAVQNPTRNPPAKLAADLHNTAVQGSKDVRRFAADFRSEQMQQLWQTTSSDEFPQGSDAWTVDYQSLLQTSPALPLPSSSMLPPLANNAKAPQTNGDDLTKRKEDVDSIIKSFNEMAAADKSLVIEKVETDSTFPLNVTVGELGFQITAKTQEGKEETKELYRVGKQPDKSSNLSAEIIEAINEHAGPSHAHLEPLLNMLASYKDLKFRPCDKCQAIFDKEVTYPVIRERNSQAKKDDPSTYWSAFHRGCAHRAS